MPLADAIPPLRNHILLPIASPPPHTYLIPTTTYPPPYMPPARNACPHTQVLWAVPCERIETALLNLADSRSAARRRNSAYWKKVAATSDRRSRTIVPTLYVTSLVVWMNVDLTDNYATDATAPMFNGFGPTSMSARGVAIVVTFCMVGALPPPLPRC